MTLDSKGKTSERKRERNLVSSSLTDQPAAGCWQKWSKAAT